MSEGLKVKLTHEQIAKLPTVPVTLIPAVENFRINVLGWADKENQVLEYELAPAGDEVLVERKPR